MFGYSCFFDARFFGCCSLAMTFHGKYHSSLIPVVPLVSQPQLEGLLLRNWQWKRQSHAVAVWLTNPLVDLSIVGTGCWLSTALLLAISTCIITIIINC
jgi:hypothetical protein